ncbi:MAG TPA: DUF1345 domain-containing protein [Acidimicrobiia bacterium]|nr:DUF1345 domain-containing protein [Acidimicrobiia bacterium]
MGIIAGFFAPWPLAVLCAWDTIAVLFLLRVWPRILRLDGDATRVLATREDATRSSADLLLVTAAVVSLAGSGWNLALKVDATSTTLQVLLTVGAILTVAVSWAVVHTVFTLRYAHLYYDDPVGGIDFSDDSEPDYYDFAYVAFTVGMTFQVSDTDIAKRPIRRAILRHALLSYLFGAVILAVVINVLGGVFS